MLGMIRQYMSLHRPLVTKMNDLLEEYDLSYSLWQVVFYLKKNGPSPLVDISHFYNIEKPSVTRRVQALTEKGFIEEGVAKNRREKLVQLNGKGEDIYQECRKKISALEFEIMQGIPAEEQKVFFEIFPKILNNINKGTTS